MLLAPQTDKLDFNGDRLSKTLVIIDSNVDNPQQLAAGVVLGAAVRILDAESDRITQITEILREYISLETLHLVSHGSPGCIDLGDSQLSLDTIPEYATEISTWFSSSSPSILIYGCNVAQGDAGREFLDKLQQLTRAEIQASNTKIGNSELGGNWQLDIAVGEGNSFKNTEIVFNLKTQKNYAGIFAAPVANDDPYTAEIEVSSLNGKNGFILKGIDNGDYSGRSVSSAGDFNGDGLDDLIVLASGSLSGEGYVVFGTSNPSASIELSSLDGSNGFVLNGINVLGSSGTELSGAGDVNGDGLADLIIGASLADPNGISNAGESYVVFGTSNSSSSLELSSLDGNNGFVLNGIDANDLSGYSVSDAGDVNGDGLADVIIGTFRANPNGISNAGESYVVFGTSNPSSSLELSSLDGSNGFVLNGIDESDFSGRVVSGAGDVNGDGLADVIIGARFADPNGNYSGESYVVFGASNPSSSLELSSLDGSNGFVLNGINSSDFLGSAVSGAGDVNGDGLADLIIGAVGADPNGDYSGESYVVFGTSNPSASIELSSLDGSNGFILNGITAFDRSGRAVSGAGDINGDGFADVIIGAPDGYTNSVNAGESYVVFGTSNPNSSIELSSLDGNNGFTLNSIVENDSLGKSVSSAGDFNGDGLADVIIGASYAAPNGINLAGESYVVFGRDFNTDEDTAFTTSSVLANDTDADGDPLTIVAIDTTVTLGNVINNGDGTFDYDPNGQFESLNDGESATDTFSYTISDGVDTDTGTVTIAIAGLGNLITGTNFDDSLIGSNGQDTISSFGGNDLLFGQNDDDHLVGGDGNDTLDGGLGADLLSGQNNEDFLVGGDGNDTLSGGVGADILFGQNDDDSLTGGDGNDTLDGGFGTDILFGQSDDDHLVGGDGNDTLNGGVGADILWGQNDDDHLVGSDGNDTLNGEVGADLLSGQNDDDSLTGGNGNDTLNGGFGNDILDGQNNNDRLVGSNGNDTVNGGFGNDILFGQNDNDSLLGGNGNDTINGGFGNDILFGQNDNDRLVGSNGDDTLIGGLGLDTLFGQVGSDRFRLESTTTANRDIIRDFEDGIDLFELTGTLSFGNLTITQAGANTNIIETATSETLATLTDITATDIDSTDFV